MAVKKSEISKDGRTPASIAPWAAFEGLPGELSKMMEQFFHRDPFQRLGLPSCLKGFDWSPTVDVAEKSDCYEITAELPGAEEKDVSVTVDEGVLTIAGEKKAERREDTKHEAFTMTAEDGSRVPYKVRFAEKDVVLKNGEAELATVTRETEDDEASGRFEIIAPTALPAGRNFADHIVLVAAAR